MVGIMWTACEMLPLPTCAKMGISRLSQLLCHSLPSARKDLAGQPSMVKTAFGAIFHTYRNTDRIEIVDPGRS